MLVFATGLSLWAPKAAPRRFTLALLLAASPGCADAAEDSTGETNGQTTGVGECGLNASAQAPQTLTDNVLDVPANVPLVVAAPNGAFYAAGGLSYPDSGGVVSNPQDIYVSRLAQDGSTRWIARWGSTIGWTDSVSDIGATADRVFVAGVAGRYETQEFYYEGNPLVRGYGDGGTLLWSWQGDPIGHSFDIPAGVVVAVGKEHVFAGFARRADDGTRTVRVFRFSAEGALTQTWDVQPESEDRLAPLKAQVLENGNLQIVGAVFGAPWLGEWSADGELELEVLDPAASTAEPTAAAISDTGVIVLVGNYDGNDHSQIPIWSYEPGLTNGRRGDLELDGELVGIFGPSVSVGCDGSVAITASVANGEETTIRLHGLAPDFAPLWELPGLGASAVTRDGVLLQAGIELGPNLDQTVTLIRTSRLQ